MDDNDPAPEDAFPLRLTPEVARAYNELKARYKEIFRDIRKRHRGVARDHLMQVNEAELQKKVRELLDGSGEPPPVD